MATRKPTAKSTPATKPKTPVKEVEAKEVEVKEEAKAPSAPSAKDKEAVVAEKNDWTLEGTVQGRPYKLKKSDCLLINNGGKGVPLKLKDYRGRTVTLPSSHYGRRDAEGRPLPDIVVLTDARKFPKWAKIRSNPPLRKYNGPQPEPKTGVKILPFFE